MTRTVRSATARGTLAMGGVYFGETAFHTFSQPGTYTVKLTVFDNDGANGVSTKMVVVAP
jgi:chitodextrinase